MYNNKVNYNNKNIIKTLTKVPEIMTISESSTQIYCRQPINFASCSSPWPNLMDLMGKNFQYIKHPKNVYAKFHTYLFVEFLCHINEYFKVLFQLILLVAQYKYDRHFMSHLVIKSKVHYASADLFILPIFLLMEIISKNVFHVNLILSNLIFFDFFIIY